MAAVAALVQWDHGDVAALLRRIAAAPPEHRRVWPFVVLRPASTTEHGVAALLVDGDVREAATHLIEADALMLPRQWVLRRALVDRFGGSDVEPLTAAA